jgi:single stranded DNA-binding protein
MRTMGTSFKASQVEGIITALKDRNDEWQERTESHSIVAWQRLAEIVGEYVVKGSKVYVEGKLQTTSWEDRQSGEKKYRTQVVARDLVLLDSRGIYLAQHRHNLLFPMARPQRGKLHEIASSQFRRTEMTEAV